MISLVSPEIEEYAVEHTTPLPDHLSELVNITSETMDMPQMLSGPIEGMLLQFLVWATEARRVLDVGTFTGFSAQMMATALPDDGQVVTCEFNPDTARVARDHFARSPHGHKIDLRLGDALETLRSIEGPFDVVFIDAEKTDYTAYYERAMEVLSPRGIIAVDNVLWDGRVLDPQSESDRAIAALNERIRRDDRVRHVLLPIRDGVMLVHRT